MDISRQVLPLFLLSLSLASPALAQSSPVCERLRDRLASLPQVVANNAEARGYSSAIARQNFEIRKTKSEIQKLRCHTSSIIEYGAEGPDECQVLIDGLARMEDNKRALAAKRDSLNQGAGQATARRRILAALDANGCNGITANGAASQPLEQDDVAPLPETGEMRAPLDGEDMDAVNGEWRAGLPAGRAGTLRTLCVRTCDGAFFPISSNVTPLSFNRDAAMCQQMCPGTETELYYHSILHQESADMVSASSGRPYRELKNAFAYMSSVGSKDKACGCDLNAFYEKARQAKPNDAKDPANGSSITHIVTKPSAGKPSSPALDSRERPYEPTDAKVRQVGPTFLPQVTSSIDLSRPALEGPQPIQQ